METNPGPSSGAPPPSPVAAIAASGTPANVAAPTPTAALATQYGGLRGARVRKDGLLPGTEEARQADLAKDRERKRLQREAVAPPPLPSMAPPPGRSQPPPPDSLGVDPGAAVGPAPLAWQPDDLNDIAGELIEAAEEARVVKYVEKARAAKIPEAVVKEIARDARLPAMSKKGLQLSSPRVGAKWLNKIGVDAAHKDEVILAGCLTAILAQGRQLDRRLEQLIQSAKAPPK